MFYIYILMSLKNRKIYIGQTNNLNDRLSRHNKGQCFSTKPYRPYKLIYFEIYQSRLEAMKRERYFKSLKSSKSIWKIINQ